MPSLRPLLLAVAFAACSGKLTGTVTGTVTSITDGDTLTLLRGTKQIRIRLVEIDAPEKSQPFGQRSRQSLAELCFRKSARVETRGHDRYGRTLGRVWCDGVDANEAQIRLGMAWVYDEYVTDRSLYALQQDARDNKRGLWSEPDARAPWAYRAGR
jgi:endonuclease YncB( thermonuclease family)